MFIKNVVLLSVIYEEKNGLRNLELILYWKIFINVLIVHMNLSWFLKAAITSLCKIFENLCKFWAKERKTGKTGTNFLYSSQSDKVFFSFSYFYVLFLCMFLCKNFNQRILIAQKKNVFRKSWTSLHPHQAIIFTSSPSACL